MPDGGTFPDGSTVRGSLDLARYEWPARHYTAYFREPYPVAERLWLGSIVTGQKDASGLLYRRNRYFDPQANQFTQEDPIGIAGGLNTYGFAGGDPVTYSDPFGLFALDGDPPGVLQRLRRFFNRFPRAAQEGIKALPDILNPPESMRDLTPPEEPPRLDARGA